VSGPSDNPAGSKLAAPAFRDRVSLFSQAVSVWLPLAAKGRRMKKVRPHLPVAGHTYCVYEIYFKGGGAALPLGSSVCIYCAPGMVVCPQVAAISPAPGMWYMLSPPRPGGCAACPNRNTYELVA
jgi:hypothetical protein